MSIKKVKQGFVVSAAGRNFLFRTKREALAFMADNKDGLPV